MKKLEDNLRISDRTVDATPYAASLIEGHRDFGYNLETALADIVDNSITAGARSVKIVANTVVAEPFIVLADDGVGMTEPQLVEAMRLGSKNPQHERSADDLGRFGLGLKSASFSQCRSLTVITRSGFKTSCARWDLDLVSKRNSWSLDIFDSADEMTGYGFLPERGTVVVWQKLDRLVGNESADREKSVAHMNRELTRAERHLRLVFHRFIGGANPQLKISLNGRMLIPIDPMASAHPATQKDPTEVLKLSGGEVKIQCHTLPHHKRMTRDEWEELGGPEGHLRSQGLYVYRERRLIITGGWLGLARQAELTKLCRISVDIPNTMDADWKIDVKKASAQLPPLVRERLKKVVERYVGTSRRTYRSRGKKLVEETRFPIWNRILKDGQVVFRPSLDHPVFQAYSDQLPEDMRDGFEQCLRLLGSGLPIDTLYAELVGNGEDVIADGAEESDLREMVRTVADTLVGSGVQDDRLAETLLMLPLLSENKETVTQLIKEYLKRSSYEAPV